MDRGIGMDALITAGPQDIGDGTITVDTGITATTTIDTGIAVKCGLKNLSGCNGCEATARLSTQERRK
jgi:hypothetical protein